MEALIEIVDGEAALRDFADSLQDIPNIGLMTLEKVEVLHGARRRPK
jgi:PII-like signaling protein